jgi:hypothetical protein
MLHDCISSRRFCIVKICCAALQMNQLASIGNNMSFQKRERLFKLQKSLFCTVGTLFYRIRAKATYRIPTTTVHRSFDFDN